MPWTSKTVEGAAPIPILNPPRLMVRLESRVIEFTNSSKSRELEATEPLASDPQTNLPVARSQFSVSPAASQSPSLVPVVAGSQNTEADAIFAEILPNTSRSLEMSKSLDAEMKLALLVVEVPNLE